MHARILLVEDDTTTRLSLLYLLRHYGYQVAEAANGEVALRLLATETFDVVITDIIMGQVDGIAVLHAARQQPSCPEVIVLTGHGSFETAVQAVRKGAFDYLVKPCASEQLTATVGRAVEQHRNERLLRTAAQTLLATFDSERPAHQPQHAEPYQPMLAEPDEPKEQHTPTITIGDLVIGPTRRDVAFHGARVRLTRTEYMLLRHLARHVGQICASSNIVHSTHRIKMEPAQAQILVKPHIHNLRKKIHPDYFVTERGLGYRLVAPNGEPDA